MASVIWLAAPLISKAAKTVVALVGGLVCMILMGAPMLSILMQPLSPWWLTGQHSVPVTAPAAALPITAPIGPMPGPQTIVSDVQRYLLAIGAGFSGNDAIIAVAVSIAENGSGNPSALSGRNDNGTFDLGLWQINSAWWPRFGGQAALTNPVNNVIAARYIWSVQGWCAWSTFESSCGRGHNSAYAAYMGRARAAVLEGS